MFKLNLKIALRSLFKNKVYAAINIGGLAIGLTAFVLMLLYINHEESYDTWSPELKSVYQIRERHSFFTPDNKEHLQESNDSRVANLIREKVPQAIAVTKVDPDWDFRTGNSVKVGNADPIIVNRMKDSDSSFFHVFKYKFLQGSENDALKAPKSVVLKQSLAKKIFGEGNVLGKVIKVVAWQGDEGIDLTVTGVVEDPQTPETAGFTAIMRTGNKDKDPVNPTNSNYCQVYARVNEGVDPELLNQTLKKVYVDYQKSTAPLKKIEYKSYFADGKYLQLKAIPLTEVHGNRPFEISWLEKLKPVIAICVFLLLVSIINFVNLATAQSVQRAKEVGVKKVMGAYKQQLIGQFLLECTLQSVVALFLSVILIEVLLPSFNTQFHVELSFWHNPNLFNMLLQLFGLFTLVTLLAGFYPAWILSNYNPAAVLKGNYSGSLKGIILRNLLVVFQFIISVTFIIAIIVMQLQTNYLNNKDLGFERSNLINIRAGYDQNLVDKIKRIPGVQYVATTTQIMGNAFNVPEQIEYNGNKISFNTVTISMDALSALGVKLLKGRIFSKEYKQDTINTVVLNEAAAKLIDKNPIGKSYKIADEDKMLNFQIIGVIKDYHNEGFDKQVLPTLYKVTTLGGTSSTNNLIVRLNSDKNAAIIEKIKVEWKHIYPDFLMEYTTLDSAFDKVLENNKRFMSMIVLFSIVSVSLSLLGLFALSTFVAKRRTKEIATRKILGASNIQIVGLLNKTFLVLVIIANLISWPVAYIVVKKWLNGFAYRIDLPLYPFFLATVVSIIIAVLTVSIQARRAALANPVKALKYE
ncbi:ABC transporter permease [Pedobacter sp. SG918]|uniref:ABC transporter permease n=1 Tax=Pedobacter sp. SG918 TaxID=2587136 RepID=UPI00146A931C|nr:ABC transporter permease [Pedobacter sp. SG918]NMN35913.1 putative ABC transport system permease protein [Pedobacter sp. SG918]